MSDPEQLPSVLGRLFSATNAHDLDTLVGCFTADYVNETPVHPARNFIGREQVRENWRRIFASIPDVHAELVRWTRKADTVWTEVLHRGTRGDGAALELRGVLIFGLADDRIRSVRFYLEPVVHDDIGPAAAVERTLGSHGATA